MQYVCVHVLWKAIYSSYAHLYVPFGVCRAHIFGFDREVDGFYHHKERAKVSNR